MEGHTNDAHTHRVLRRFALVALLAGCAVVVSWAVSGRQASVLGVGQSVSVSVDCDANGDLFGDISGVPAPYPVAFDVFVTDHIPGDGSWVEIPGSRVSLIANSSSINYGPLDTSQHRAEFNSMRVETTLSNEKSQSLSCPSGTATPAVTSTAAITRTPGTTQTVPAQTPTVEVSTSTPTPVPTTTPVQATATSGSAPGGTATAGAAANPSSVPTLVNTVLAAQSTDNVPPPAGVSLPGTGHGQADGSSRIELLVGALGVASACGGLWAIGRARNASQS